MLILEKISINFEFFFILSLVLLLVWPNNTFYYMIDAAAINSTICYLIRHQEDLEKYYKGARRNSLENLALALIKSGIK